MTQRGSMVELYIDHGRGADEENARIFNALSAHEAEIEDAYRGLLAWEPLEGKRACRIAQRFDLGGYRDEAKWPEVHDAMVDALIRLEQALRPQLARLAN